MGFPVEERFVAAAEATLGATLPSWYRDRMKRDNGGQLATAQDSWQLHPIFDDSDRKRLRRTCNDIVRETDAARAWPSFPTEAVAIGANGSGDRLVFLRDAQAPGRFSNTLWWWDHETGQVAEIAGDIRDLVGEEDA